jgi:hypothetical protein
MTDEIIRKAYTTDKAVGKQRHPGQFKPGQSGNPLGRAKGSRNKATLAALAALEGDLEAVTSKLIKKAKAGEQWAITLMINKLIPNVRSAPVKFPLPDGDLGKSLQAVLRLVSQGRMTIEDGQGIASIVSALGLAQQIEELTKKVEALLR